jgi:hypothetical protein
MASNSHKRSMMIISKDNVRPYSAGTKKRKSTPNIGDQNISK